MSTCHIPPPGVVKWVWNAAINFHQAPLAWLVVAVILFLDVFVDLDQSALGDRDRDLQEGVLTKVPPIIHRRELDASWERLGNGAEGEAEEDGVYVGGVAFTQLRFVPDEFAAFGDASFMFLRSNRETLAIQLGGVVVVSDTYEHDLLVAQIKRNARRAL